MVLETTLPVASADKISGVAGTNLSGHRVVIKDNDGKIYYADKDTPTHLWKVLGITFASALLGNTVNIEAFGRVVETSWAWVMGVPIFCGNNGILTQSPPSSGFSLILGTPMSATEMFVNIKQAIMLV